MRNLIEWYNKMLKDEKGQTMVEYALMLALVAIIVAAFIPGVTNAISTTYTNIAAAL